MSADAARAARNAMALDTLDALPMLVAVVDARGDIVSVNGAWRTRAREHDASDIETAEGRNFFDICEAAASEPDGEQAVRVASALRDVLLARRADFDEQQSCRVGPSRRWFRTRIGSVTRGGERFAIVSYDDITAQKDVELAMARAERALHHAQEVGRVGTWTADLVRGVFHSSPEGARLMGWAPGEHTPEELREVIHPDDRALQQAAWERAMVTGHFDIQHRAVVRGETRWFHVRGEIRRDGSGRPIDAVGVAQDITEERRILEALQETRAQYQGLADTSPDAIFVNRNDHVAFVNPACVALFGARSEVDLIGRPVLSLFHPDDHAQIIGRIATLRDGQPVPRAEERIVTLDGRIVPVEVVAAPFTDSGGRAFHVVLRDISDRLQMQRALSNERAGLRTLLDTLPDCVWLKDVNGRFLLANHAFERLVGMDERALVGCTDDDVVPRDLAELYRAQDRRVIESGRPLTIAPQTATLAATGEERWLEAVKAPLYSDGRLVGVLGIARDITETQRIQAELARSEQQRQFALDAAGLGTWYRQAGSEQLFLDARSRALLDLETDDDGAPVPVEAVLARMPPEDRARVAEIQNVQITRPRSIEVRIIRRDGSVRWLLAHLHVGSMPGPDGQPRLVRSGTLQDITDRKEQEVMVSRFVSASPVVIYALQIAGDRLLLRWLSDNIQHFSGWTVEHASQSEWWSENIHPEDRDRVLAWSGLRAIGEHQTQEFRFRRADGRYMWVADEKRLVRDAAGRPAEVIGSWTDITERVALEEQLRQSQKIEALGLLAGGIAHDFNNILTVVSGNVDLLAPHLPVATAERTLLEEIRVAGDRAASLTRQLLAFSRSQVLAPRVVALNAVVDRIRTMLTRLIGEDIQFEARLAPDSGWVLVDQGQLEQVIVNLAVNARDAMPRGGRLVIETSAVDLQGEYARRHRGVEPGPYARLVIADTGHGMSSDLLARIWEPFFTTKAPGKGTGLGLSTVFGTVKQSGGHIDVESIVGQGTRFTIHLPRVAQPPDQEVPQPDTTTGAERQRGHETILLVEDEEAVRKLTRMALERSGYSVLTAANGRAAVEVAERHGGSIDLLVTDVVMPEMRGPDLADVLRERRPDIKVLFMSGYIQDAGDRTDVSEQSFLHKPFSLRQLTDRVRGLLDGPA